MKKKEILTGQKLDAELVRMRRAGLSTESIAGALSYELNCSEKELKCYIKEITETLKTFENYDLVEKIILCDLCKTIDDTKYFIFDDKAKTKTEISTTSLNSLFDLEYLYKKVKHLKTVYNPYTNKAYLNENGVVFFNRYTPPDWRHAEFYRAEKRSVSTLPEIYQDFFTHLFNGDQDSVQYVLKWLSNSLKNRNYAYLVTVGEQGVGKGILYAIVAELHGLANAGTIEGKRFFESTFNSEMENKTIYYVDEIHKLAAKETNRIKMMVNQNVRIEGKGKDAKEVLNTVNLMMSSNDVGCLDIPVQERRYSIVSLTQKPLLQHWEGSFEQKLKDLFSPENIALLGHYLLSSVKYSKEEMLNAFKSTTKMAEIKDQSLEDWQDYFLFGYCREFAGETKSVTMVLDDVKTRASVRRERLSRQTIRELGRRFKANGKKFFIETKMNEHGKDGVSAFKFMELHEQPDRADFNLTTMED